jgi:UDP-glucose 4-epimerase
LPVNSIRIFNAYGPRVRTTGAYGAVFGVFFKQKLENKPFTVVGNGNQKRDFVFVTDVVNAFYKAATNKVSGQIFNLGSGKPKSVNELVKILGGKKIYIPKRPGEPNITHADTRKIKKILKWSPKISFKEGVNEMLKDINNWKSAPLWNSISIKRATKSWFYFMKGK